MNSARKKLRTKILSLRKQLSDDEQSLLSQKTFGLLMQFQPFKQANKIGAYYPIQNECAILSQLFKATPEKKIFLPCCDPQKKLTFGRFQQETPLIKNKFGIPEPHCLSGDTISPFDLDIIFIPGIVFDFQRNRLGYGGGYYDRTFSSLINILTPLHKKPLLLGTCFSFQVVTHLPPQNWDIKMDGLVTENFIFVDKSSQ